MPSLFKKLFRRNGKPTSESGGTSPTSGSKPKTANAGTKTASSRTPTAASAKSKRIASSQRGASATKTAAPSGSNNHRPRERRPKSEEDERKNRSPSLTTTATTWKSAPSINPAAPNADMSPNKPYQTSTSTRVLSPRNNQPLSASKAKPARSPGPIDLDDLEESDENRSNTQVLSKKHLEQFNMEHPPQQPSASLYGMKDALPPKGDRSESSASEFNLSTDAEDDEYNNMRKQYQITDSSALDTSTPARSSPNDDQDNTVFPELRDINPAEDNHTASSATRWSKEEDSHAASSTTRWSREEDMRAWGLSPQGSTKENLTETTPRQEDLNFANFDNAFPDPNAFASSVSPSQTTTTITTKSDSRVIIEAHDLIGSTSSRKSRTSSASAAVVDTSLSDLLAQAKMASSRRNAGKPSAASVNSAPAISSSYLRHHGVRSDAASSDHNQTTSVSDIIQSLEATNAARLSSSSRRSVGSRDSAKERIRERRRRRQMMEQEAASSGEDEQDSWLFDEVTGALGPRGVAADMESLGGRSNSSKRSHRSRRSKRSSRHHKSSSNESVDSRNSRNSRNSRSSRYSHRSTRSYLSHMSQESRSVANDLLRLEMQLAMVGSTENGSTNNESAIAAAAATVAASTKQSGGGSVSGSINSRASRSSRRTTSIAKRSKISVVAPPGKLGIILANKADSKGTVVSGVRTSSVLAEKISPGDRIIAIDGEDCSRMTVSEITTIMARKADFERILTVLTTPKRTNEITTPSSEYSNSKSYRHSR